MNKLNGDSVSVVLNISDCRGFGKIKKPSVTAKFNNQEFKTNLKMATTHSKDSACTELVWRMEKTAAKKARGEYAHIRLDIFIMESKFLGYAMICLRTAKIISGNGALCYRWIRLNSVPAEFKQGNPEIYIALSMQECKDQPVPQANPLSSATVTNITKPLKKCKNPEEPNEPQSVPVSIPSINATESSEPIVPSETPQPTDTTETPEPTKVPQTIETTESTENTPTACAESETEPEAKLEQEAAPELEPNLVTKDEDAKEHLKRNATTAENESLPSLLGASSIVLEKNQEPATYTRPASGRPHTNLYSRTTVHIMMHSLFWLDKIPAKNILIIFYHPTVKTQKRYRTSTRVQPGTTYLPFENVECKLTFVMLKWDKINVLERYPPTIQICNADTKQPLTKTLVLDQKTIEKTENNVFVFKTKDESRLCSSIIYIKISEDADKIERNPEAELMPIIIADSCVRHNLRQFEEWSMSEKKAPRRVEHFRDHMNYHANIQERKAVEVVQEEKEKNTKPSTDDHN